MIRINSKVHPKMLQNFDSQQFPDCTVLTSTGKVSLVLAYLSIDSAYFENVTESEVDLSYLPQNALVRVLRALYGDQLVAYSVQDLEQLYLIIQQLRIEDYKQTIVQNIQKNKDLMNNIQIIEFCFKNSLMVEDIKKYHFQNRLRCLQDNRNFLVLNKITISTLIVLLLEFYEEFGENSFPIINGILQNYFNRNSIRAVNFFQEEGTETLQFIWERYHHSLPTDKSARQKKVFPLQTSISQMIKPKSSHTEQNAVQNKDRRIFQLKSLIADKDKIIEKLRKELCEIKKDSGRSSQTRTPIKANFDEEDDIQMSILEGFKNINKSKTLIMTKKDDESSSEQQTAFQKESERQKSSKVSTYHKIHRT